MGRHSKNKNDKPASSGPTVSGAQFDSQFSTSAINAGPAQTADQRIAALKNVVSDSRRNTRKD